MSDQETKPTAASSRIGTQRSLRGLVTPMRVLTLALVAFFGYRIYAADDSLGGDRAVAALEHGRTYASYILDGRKDPLSEVVAGEAKGKLQRDGLPTTWDILPSTMYNHPDVPASSPLWDPVKVLYARGTEGGAPGPMRAATYETSGAFYVISFVGQDSAYELGANDVATDGVPMMTSVVLQHVIDDRGSKLKLLGRKAARAFWMSPERYERGHWELVNYDYTFNRRDYYDWVRANGARVQAKFEKDNADFMSNVRSNPQAFVAATVGKSHTNAQSQYQHAVEIERAQIDAAKAFAASRKDS